MRRKLWIGSVIVAAAIGLSLVVFNILGVFPGRSSTVEAVVLDQEEFNARLEEVLGRKEAAILYFYSSEIFDKQPEIGSKSQELVSNLGNSLRGSSIIGFDLDQAPDFWPTELYGVRYVPTFVVMRPGQGITGRAQGVVDPAVIERLARGEAAGSGGSAASPSATDSALAVSDALASGKPVFLYFYADWCSYCKKLKPLIDELEGEYGNDIAFVRSNTDVEPSFAAAYGITGVPKAFLLDRNGVVVDTFGYGHPKSKFESSFRNVIGSK